MFLDRFASLLDACGRTHGALNNVVFVTLKLALSVARKRCARLVDSASVGRLRRMCITHRAASRGTTP